LNVGTLLESLSDFRGVVDLGDVSVHSGLIESPVLPSTSSLNQSSTIRLRNRETR
jgi:hypothetical protein